MDSLPNTLSFSNVGEPGDKPGSPRTAGERSIGRDGDFLTTPWTAYDAERAFSAGRRTINQLQHATSGSLLNAKTWCGSWAGAVAENDAARKKIGCSDRVTLIFTPIVRLSYSAQPSKVVSAKTRATGTSRETIHLDDDDEV
ncbi:BQ5605_C008g05233 [Microbotryum silenes-dioicae]|uniref:BQ5605_C008g05233 protein n=1 Tax=Microbotryum silenes-dioicae TaxID=796604 RepID=A0A2X0MCT9_9BASI|nr:BQ5605_C008g05233 [Microbotryum silenes-dioicae]